MSRNGYGKTRKHKHKHKFKVMEARNIRDRLVKKPGMLDHTGVEDSMLCMMSMKCNTYYYQVLLD